MRAEFGNLTHCAVPVLSCTAVNLCSYYYTHTIIYDTLHTMYNVYCIAGVTNLWPAGQMWPFSNPEEQKKRSPKKICKDCQKTKSAS